MDVFDLKARAQAEGLRNRAIEPNVAVATVRTLPPATNACPCGNLMTIEDRGPLCRQCRLERASR